MKVAEKPGGWHAGVLGSPRGSARRGAQRVGIPVHGWFPEPSPVSPGDLEATWSVARTFDQNRFVSFAVHLEDPGKLEFTRWSWSPQTSAIMFSYWREDAREETLTTFWSVGINGWTRAYARTGDLSGHAVLLDATSLCDISQDYCDLVGAGGEGGSGGTLRIDLQGSGVWRFLVLRGSDAPETPTNVTLQVQAKAWALLEQDEGPAMFHADEDFQGGPSTGISNGRLSSKAAMQ